MYTKERAKNHKFVQVGEHRVPWPVLPEYEEDIRNFGLPKEQQKFIPVSLPKDLHRWDNIRQAQFIEPEWHKRLNGEWWYIYGELVYLTGTAYLFFNYWTMETGERPTFRMEAVEFFLLWDWVCDDPNSLGILDIKCRRLGDTEKALCCLYDMATRHKNVHVGMQNINDESAKGNFKRLVKAHRAMPFFFKPATKGKEAPSEILEFAVPSEVMTKDRLKNKKVSQTGLDSAIDFKPMIETGYDGRRLKAFHLDEAFKIKPARASVEKLWDITKLCLTLDNGRKVIGKAILTSTVEDMEDGKTVEMARKFWDDADPGNKKPSGQTRNGFTRVFRGYDKAAPPDDYGRHLVSQAKSLRDKDIAALKAQNKFSELMSIYRRQPADIEEALMPPPNDAVLDVGLIEMRHYQLQNGLSRWDKTIDWNGQKAISRFAKAGNLVWEDQQGGKVKWVPNQNGKWMISQHPAEPNKVNSVRGKKTPGNMTSFRMGIDPYDASSTEKKGSDGAFVVKRRFNLNLEDDLEVDHHNVVLNPERMMTGQIVCDYRARPENPYHFYDDVLKTMIYYGCAGLIERNKSGLITWMDNMPGQVYDAFIQRVPPTIKPRAAAHEKGIFMDDDIVSRWIDALQVRVKNEIWANYHPRVIADCRGFSPDKKVRTKHDLVVAWGLAELADYDERPYTPEVITTQWVNSVFAEYEDFAIN